MQANAATINEMIKSIPDPRMREMYGNIVSGQYKFKVYCINPRVNPATRKPYHAKMCAIGYIAGNGQVVDAQTVDKRGEPIAGIESSRDRFDGRKGFKCYCGNWSIQCEEELGVLKQSRAPLPPTKSELQQIFEKLKSSGKQQLKFVNGAASYDGFLLQEVK